MKFEIEEISIILNNLFYEVKENQIITNKIYKKLRKVIREKKLNLDKNSQIQDIDIWLDKYLGIR